MRRTASEREKNAKKKSTTERNREEFKPKDVRVLASKSRLRVVELCSSSLSLDSLSLSPLPSKTMVFFRERSNKRALRVFIVHEHERKLKPLPTEFRPLARHVSSRGAIPRRARTTTYRIYYPFPHDL